VKERSTERPSGNSTRVLGLERGVPGNGAHRGASIPYVPNGTGRNRRSVWEIPTQPYAEAHFATFPEALVEPCILAGSPAGGIVLDPFAGSGTVGEVCARHGRRFVGTDLNPTYASLACARTAQAGLL
jgi:site-specific DNA-methyltransferase (cytosine-N4-specific)